MQVEKYTTNKGKYGIIVDGYNGQTFLKNMYN